MESLSETLNPSIPRKQPRFYSTGSSRNPSRDCDLGIYGVLAGERPAVVVYGAPPAPVSSLLPEPPDLNMSSRLPREPSCLDILQFFTLKRCTMTKFETKQGQR